MNSFEAAVKTMDKTYIGIYHKVIKCTINMAWHDF